MDFDFAFLSCTSDLSYSMGRQRIYWAFRGVPFTHLHVRRRFGLKALKSSGFAEVDYQQMTTDLGGTRPRPCLLILKYKEQVYIEVAPTEAHIFAPTEELAHEVARLLAEHGKYAPRNDCFFVDIVNEWSWKDWETCSLPRPTWLPCAEKELGLLYGDSFVPWHQRHVALLQNQKPGLTILSGPAGTGKTSYFQYLMATLGETFRFTLIPCGFHDRLKESDLYKKLREEVVSGHRHPLRILVVEDANALFDEHRLDNGKGQDALSQWKARTNGLLGGVHLICILQSPGASLVSPPQAPIGFPVMTWDFRPLCRPEVEKLAQSRGLPVPPTHGEATLAEVFGQTQSRPVTHAEQEGSTAQ